MWSSLACLLEAIVTLSIVATDVIEALWLCRIRQSSPSEVYTCERLPTAVKAETFHTRRDRVSSEVLLYSWLSGSVREGKVSQ